MQRFRFSEPLSGQIAHNLQSMSDEAPVDGSTEFRPEHAPRVPTPSRFAPGTLLADRYQIVSQLGRGGMGEVFRADDLKLGHPVALKFLPREVMHDRALTKRLLDEVRIGRQVSHPNVCRVYDVVEWEGTHFLAMEYVDGEDLSSLLRRIGGLPTEKASEIARDIAAGLAAAHDLGVVHRDLKPANIMIDGRGRARITDFGLAALAQDLTGRNGVAGTPAYMAPEQLRGEALTPKSDVYALGLVIYEVFTGRRLFNGSSLDEIRTQRTAQKTTSVSSVARDIDPIVGRIVDRCLQDDPGSRPSAHGVFASLPGGDPLAAAVAAGETPSPAMVAAAGATGELTPAIAWSLFALAVVSLIAIAFLSNRSMLFRLVGLPKSTEVMDARADEIAQQLGYPGPRAASAGEWIFNADFLTWFRYRGGNRSMRDLASARPGVFGYAGRFFGKPLIALDPEARIQAFDPPLTEPGMITVFLDSQGRLVGFVAVPPDVVVPAQQTVDWTPAFSAAALDAGRFRRVVPVWSAPVDSDRKYAWEGTVAGQPGVPLRIEAAERAGRIVSFIVHGPEDAPRPMTEPRVSIGDFIGRSANVVPVLAICAGILLALRNIRRARGDRRGAFRVAAISFFATFAGLMLRADHRSILDGEWNVLQHAVSRGLFTAAILWVLYVALEPIVRRRWPRMLIAWTRLIGGKPRDPMAGRDLLVGIVVGLLMMVLFHLAHVAPAWLGGSVSPIQVATSPFASTRHVLYFLLKTVGESAVSAITIVSVLVLLRALLRKSAMAVAVLFVILAAGFCLGGMETVPMIIQALVCAALVAGILLRFGFLAVFALIYTYSLLLVLPVTLDTSAWYFGRSLLGMAFLGAVALYGAIIAIGQKPLFGKPLFEE
jgi:hypothetical protein